MDENNGWIEYKKLVINELVRINEQAKETNIIIRKIEKDIATLKVKSSIWGAVAGSIPALIVALYFILSK